MIRLLPGLAEVFRTYLGQGLMMDPWLSGLPTEEFSYDSQSLLHDAADGLAAEHWREPLISQTVGTLPMTRALGRRAVGEALNSSAAAIAFERTGRVRVERATAGEAVRRLEAYIRRCDYGAVVRVYVAVTLTLNLAAIGYYERLSEADFVSGLRHRPWVHQPLDDELLAMVATGNCRLSVAQGRRWVRLTARGRQTFARMREELDAAGYLAERLRTMRASRFGPTDSSDRVEVQVVAGEAEQQLAFLTFSGLRSGMRVLQVGCGAGRRMFDGGLWSAVGPTGSLVGTEALPDPLEAARAEASRRGAGNVRFVQARGEALPFEDASFDAAVCLGNLGFVDRSRTIAEMRRVVRPGGIIVAGDACRLHLDQPWFHEWFRPIFAAAQRQGLAVQSPHPDPGEVGRLCQEAGLQKVEVTRRALQVVLSDPDTAVRLIMQGINYFPQVLAVLPWAAWSELSKELVARGEAVCARTTPDQRRVPFAVEYARAIVPD